MHQVTLCVTGTRSVPGCIPTRSVGTINIFASRLLAIFEALQIFDMLAVRDVLHHRP
jgi:hypothetical protein